MTQDELHNRMERLLAFLEEDPENPSLLRDAAEVALDAGEPQQAKGLFSRLRDAGKLTEADSNLWAIAAMRSGEPQMAARTFESLLDQQPGNHALAFNLAWSRMLAGDFVGAREALSREAVEALPQAAQLEVKLLHRSGEFDTAAERAKEHLARHGDYPPLLAAVSTLAMDLEDISLARDCAERGGEHPEALTTLATLALDEQDPGRAQAMFEKSLAADQNSPRAWVGLGLAELARGNSAQAAEHIERGAALFDSHLGSWIAAGWAWLIAGETDKARDRFEHAIEIDENFAEAQGSMAVVEALEGQIEAAQHRAEIAARLDRQSFAAAFARILISSAGGDDETAQRIAAIALSRPIDSHGRTIADAIARMVR